MIETHGRSRYAAALISWGEDCWACHSHNRRALMTEKILKDEAGAATAEYAIATLAAVGFAGLLVAVLRSDEVRAILTDLIRGALSVAG